MDSAFYVSLQEAPIREMIDHSIAMKDNKKGPPTIEVNTMLHLSPRAAVQAKDLLKLYLEWETHRRAKITIACCTPCTRATWWARKTTARPSRGGPAYLGFVPVSPDLAPFRYEWKKDELITRRNGSERQPTLNPGVDALASGPDPGNSPRSAGPASRGRHPYYRDLAKERGEVSSFHALSTSGLATIEAVVLGQVG